MNGPQHSHGYNPSFPALFSRNKLLDNLKFRGVIRNIGRTALGGKQLDVFWNSFP